MDLAIEKHPVGGVDYPRTYQELLEWFPDNDACLDFLAQLRWPNGFVCPVCNGSSCWLTGAGLWMCQTCSRRTSVTAGTIFHRTRTPLSSWFAAIWFLTSQKNGISAQGLQRVLGFGSYETAWAWMHKLRRAMVRPDRELLSGIVELDETYVGGRSKGRPGGSSMKIPVLIAVERAETGKALGRVRLEVADVSRSLETIDFAQHVIAKGSTIRTDGANMMGRLVKLGYTHEPTVAMRAKDPEAVTPGVHLVASLLKRWLYGTLHYAVTEEQLPYYLDEFTFRFNRRNSRSRGLLFYRLLQQAVNTDPHPLHELLHA